jgi:hypothetical protein
MDADDTAQIEESLRKALSVDLSRGRAAVTEFGWQELLEEDPAAAVSTLFAVAGDLLVPGSFLDDVLIAASGLDVPEGARVLLPPPGASEPASRVGADAMISGLAQRGDGPILAACRGTDGGVTFALTETDVLADGETLDPDAGWTVVDDPDPRVMSAVECPDPGATWATMVGAGQRAIAHELTAVAARMLAMTVEHVSTRHQFGQALGTFQSVKHQLADVRLWVEVAQLSAAAAWESDAPELALLAKLAAIRASRTARTACQQLLGGMGFTWEHDFHLYLRRALTLEPLLGSSSVLHQQLGAALRDGHVADTLVPL